MARVAERAAVSRPAAGTGTAVHPERSGHGCHNGLENGSGQLVSGWPGAGTGWTFWRPGTIRKSGGTTGAASVVARSALISTDSL